MDFLQAFAEGLRDPNVYLLAFIYIEVGGYVAFLLWILSSR
jgi:hypothetical protein